MSKIGKWEKTNELRWNRVHRLKQTLWGFKYKEYDRFEVLEQKIINTDGREYWKKVDCINTFVEGGEYIDI